MLSPSISNKFFELMTLAPRVASLRITKILTAGYQPNKTELFEINRMWSEKIDAVQDSAHAIALESARFQQKLMGVFWAKCFSPDVTNALWQGWWHYAPIATAKMTEQTLSAYHSRVKANAKRLG